MLTDDTHVNINSFNLDITRVRPAPLYAPVPCQPIGGQDNLLPALDELLFRKAPQNLQVVRHGLLPIISVLKRALGDLLQLPQRLPAQQGSLLIPAGVVGDG